MLAYIVELIIKDNALTLKVYCELKDKEVVFEGGV
jgi:hypothetical protein